MAQKEKFSITYSHMPFGLKYLSVQILFEATVFNAFLTFSVLPDLSCQKKLLP